MAREFVRASSQYISYGTSVNALDSATACTISFYIWLNNLTSSHKVVGEWGNAIADAGYLIEIDTNGKVGLVFRDDADNNRLHGKRLATGISTGGWVHYVGTWTAPSTWVMYVNGVNQSVEAWIDQNGNLATINTAGSAMRIGSDDSPGGYVDGKIAELAIWDIVQPAAVAAALGAGYSPAFFKKNLRFYDPLIGSGSGERDIARGFTGTVTGATKFAHPRITYPTRAMDVFAPATAASSAWSIFDGCFTS